MFSRTTLRQATPRLSLPPAIQQLFNWYPRRGGEFLANMLAGHNLFISDIPKQFNTQHAKHFSFIKSLCITPLFTLTIVHYISSFCLYPTRKNIISPLMNELSKKTEAQHEWFQVINKKNSPTDVIIWRVAMICSQIILFPMWCLLSALAPQLIHAMLENINHILYQKLSYISKESPIFVEQCMQESREAEAFHSQQLCIPTDYAAAVIIVLLVLYLTS